MLLFIRGDNIKSIKFVLGIIILFSSSNFMNVSAFTETPYAGDIYDITCTDIVRRIQKGPKFRVNLIEMQRVVEVGSTCEAFNEKVVGRLTEFINPSAFEEVIFNQYTELEKEYSVSTSVTVGIQYERLIKLSVGLEDIVNIGVDDQLQTGYFYSKTSTKQYTENVKSGTSLTTKINLSVIPQGQAVALSYAGDFFEVDFKSYQNEYYWWGTYKTSGTEKSGIAQIVKFRYLTQFYSDGSHQAILTRPY